MKLTPLARRAAAALGLAVAITRPLHAQNVLFTELDGKFMAVRAAKMNRAIVENEGKRVLADGRRYVLQKTAEYRPECIDVRNVRVTSHHLNMDGADLNQEFSFYGSLETQYYLEDVFIVLALDTERMGKVLFLQEVGTLESRTPRTISITVPIEHGGIGEGKYKLHVFAGGRELLTTQMPLMYRDQLVDGMIRKRISGVTDAGPTLFSGPVPEYPAKLRKAGTNGQAVITVLIDAKGRVVDPQVKTASEPAFGEAALAAVRLWRFLPQVKKGRPVDAKVDVPVNFSPPAKS